MSRRAAIAVALAAIALPAAVARAAPLSACTGARGTIVAVDFTHWGGPVVRGCGVGAASGLALLHAAGFTSSGDQHDGPAFICRLGDTAFRNGTQYPTPGEDACIQTPPSSAYWSYWVAHAGRDTWSYSSLGAMSDVPTSGEVELWTFGNAKRPTVTPASLRPQALTTAVTTTTTESTQTTQAATHASSTSAATTASSHTAAPKRRQSRAHKRHTTHATTTVAATAAPNAGAVPVVAAKPTKVRASTGSPASLIVGICLVAVLCGGAGWATWRRRRLA